MTVNGIMGEIARYINRNSLFRASTTGDVIEIWKDGESVSLPPVMSIYCTITGRIFVSNNESRFVVGTVAEIHFADVVSALYSICP